MKFHKQRENNTRENNTLFTYIRLHMIFLYEPLHCPTPHTHAHSGGTHSRLTTSILLRLLVLESLVSALACTLV